VTRRRNANKKENAVTSSELWMIIDILVETNEVSAREIYIRLQAQRKGMQT